MFASKILLTKPTPQLQIPNNPTSNSFSFLTLIMNPRIAAYAVLGFRSTAAFSGHPLVLQSTFNSGRSQRSLTQTHKNMSTSTDDNDVVDIAANIGHVRQMMDDAIASSERQSDSVRLVAVSKTKPLELLQAAYEVRLIYLVCIIM